MAHPLAAERLVGPLKKIDRAKQHVLDFNAAVQGFIDTKPYDSITEYDSKTAQYVRRVKRVERVTTDVAIIFGDILFCLRSALDHLAYQLVLVGADAIGHVLTAKELKAPAFPIGDDVGNYQARRGADVKHARPDAIKHIDGFQPYRGGKGDILWKIRRLNDTDKHRLLLPVVGSFGKARVLTLDTFNSLRFRGLPIHWAAQIARNRPLGTFGELEIPGTPSGKKCPLEVGDVLFTGPAALKDQEHVEIIAHVAISEPGVVECEPILETVQHMTDFVSMIVPTFEQFLV